MTRHSGDEPLETLSEALGFTETVVEVGHTHPGVRHVLEAAGGTIGFLVSLDDERITDLDVEVGIGHRGVEKEIEALPWHRALPYVRRMGLASGLMAEIGYCLAVEELAGIATPDRAIWWRMLASEAARVSDHFARLAAIATAIGLPAAKRVAERGGVQAAGVLAAISGGAGFPAWLRLGGVAAAPPPAFGAEWKRAHEALEVTLGQFEATAVDNPSCQQRLRGVAPLSAEDCLAWGVTGPCLRAAGNPMDVRRDAPYLAYGAVDFDVPIGENGDAFDRLLIVVEEIRQSLRIIDQAEALLASLGPGATMTVEPGWREPAKLDAGERAQAGLEGPAIPAGESSSSIESSTGELGFLLVSDGDALPRRIRIRAASFMNAQALSKMLRGAHLDDLLPTVATMHIVSGECDR